jgi:hypothetical protein
VIENNFLGKTMNRFNTPVLRCLQFGSIALATSALFACGGGGSSPDGTINGTVAIGAPMQNGAITFVCKNGSANTTTDANGAFSVKFKFDGPCTITASGGATTLHSFAPGAGTVNITSLTELLLSYLAGQLGTTVDNLLASLPTNSTYQSALSNSSTIANAEAAVAKIIKDTYGITLSSSAFLTTAFTVGQGQDKDLDQLMAAGAIDATGKPVATLTAAVTAAGTAAGGGSSGGTPGGGATGGTGGTGTVSQ